MVKNNSGPRIDFLNNSLCSLMTSLSTPLFTGFSSFLCFSSFRREVNNTIVQEGSGVELHQCANYADREPACYTNAAQDNKSKSSSFVFCFFVFPLFVWSHHTADCHMEFGLKHFTGSGGLLNYTTVQTVFSVVSNRTALASVGFMLVSYIGFSNDAWPLELS